MNDPLRDTLSELVDALDRLGIRYAIAGSLASSAHGAVRATFDADLIALIAPFQVGRLSNELGKRWYADEELMGRALREGRAFNVVHTGTALKCDIFPVSTEFHQVQLERARMTLLPPPISLNCMVTTAEDILLAKLRWYADGGGISERQWKDITTLISVRQNLDWPYITEWAGRLRVTDLLAKAREDAVR